MEVRPGYRQTDVGVIPEEWESRACGDVFTLKSGFAFSSGFFSESGPIVLTPGNFKLEGGLYFEARNTKRYSGTYDSSMTFNRGDLLIVMTDLTPDCNLLGKPAFVTTDDVILHNQRIGRVVFKGRDTNENFLFYVLLSRDYLNRIKGMATGSTVRHTSNKSIYSVPIPIPPLPEQRAIVGALGDVDALIGALDQLIAKKRDLKQAAMQQLLTGQTRLAGFRGECEVKRLEEVASLIKGRGLSKGQISASGTRPCILYGELFTTYGRAITEVVSKTTADYGLPSQAGDVLIPGSTTTTGIDLATASALLQEGVALGGDINVIRQKASAFEPVFLANYLTHVMRSAIAELAQGITIIHLYGRDLRTLSLRLPKVEEQTAIAAVLSDMDAEIAALEQRLAKTRALKQGMMQELLTGRTRLV